ncbi:MAG: glutamate racemase [Clostridia bacterium]|nr:glutamate racemase [Clostridia bacterium]
MSDNRAIGIFDSGLGGLTVAKEIVKLLPEENIVYFGDTGRVPYGTRSHDTIKKYAAQDERFLLSKDVKIIVAACGTVSSVAGENEKSLPVPFVEVVSHSVRAAVKATKNKKIGVLATPATIKSGSHKRQILEIMPDAVVVENSANLLVPLVEAGWIDEKDSVVLETVRRYLEPMKEQGVDTLILGCTHFPVLAPVISKVLGEGVTLINMGASTAYAVKELLEKNDALNDGCKAPEKLFFVSDKTQTFKETAAVLLGEREELIIEQVDINRV